MQYAVGPAQEEHSHHSQVEAGESFDHISAERALQKGSEAHFTFPALHCRPKTPMGRNPRLFVISRVAIGQGQYLMSSGRPTIAPRSHAHR